MTRSPWTAEDHALLLALAAYEESLCSGGCGQPREKAHHPDNNGEYVIDDDPMGGHASQCEACAEIQRYKAENKDPVPGLFLALLHDRDYDARPLPAGRTFGPRRPTTA